MLLLSCAFCVSLCVEWLLLFKSVLCAKDGGDHHRYDSRRSGHAAEAPRQDVHGCSKRRRSYGALFLLGVWLLLWTEKGSQHIRYTSYYSCNYNSFVLLEISNSCTRNLIKNLCGNGLFSFLFKCRHRTSTPSFCQNLLPPPSVVLPLNLNPRFFSLLHPSCLIFWWALLFSASCYHFSFSSERTLSGTVAERKGLGFRVWLDMWGVVWMLEETHIAECVWATDDVCVCVIDWSSSHCERFCHEGKRAQGWSPDIYLGRYNLERAHRPCKPSPWHVQHLPKGFLFYYFPSLCTITFVLLPCTFLMHKNFYWFSDFVPKVQMKEVAPAARKQDTRLSFAFVYPDWWGHNVIWNLGSYSVADPSASISIFSIHKASWVGATYSWCFFLFWGHISPSYSFPWTLSACKMAVALYMHIGSLLYALVEFLYLDLLLGQRYFCLWIVVSFWISEAGGHAVLFIY